MGQDRFAALVEQAVNVCAEKIDENELYEPLRENLLVVQTALTANDDAVHYTVNRVMSGNGPTFWAEVRKLGSFRLTDSTTIVSLVHEVAQLLRPMLETKTI